MAACFPSSGGEGKGRSHCGSGSLTAELSGSELGECGRPCVISNPPGAIAGEFTEAFPGLERETLLISSGKAGQQRTLCRAAAAAGNVQHLMQRFHRTSWWRFESATPSGTAQGSEPLQRLKCFSNAGRRRRRGQREKTDRWTREENKHIGENIQYNGTDKDHLF